MTRCDVLDTLEAAIVTRRTVSVTLADGSVRSGRPVALRSVDGDDLCTFADGASVAVSAIVAAAAQ